jgi:hypothetical protein
MFNELREEYNLKTTTYETKTMAFKRIHLVRSKIWIDVSILEIVDYLIICASNLDSSLVTRFWLKKIDSKEQPCRYPNNIL